MSEAQMDDPNQQQPDEQQTEPQMSEAEAEARSHGWLPQDEYQGDPEKWVDADTFNIRGQFIGELKEAKAEARRAKQMADEALQRNNVFREQQNAVLRQQIQKLEHDLQEAVKDADVESAQAIQKNIDDAKDAIQEPAQVAPQGVQEAQTTIEAWNAKNPWINETTPKAAFAKDVFQRYIMENQSQPPEQLINNAISTVESRLSEEFPEQNPNRQRPGAYARGNNTRSSQQVNTLTMNDLTREEMGVWHANQAYYKDEADFLQVVAEARKGVQ